MSEESGRRRSILEETDRPIGGLRSEEQSRRARAMPKSPWLIAAVVLSTVAGLIHFAVAPEHFQEWIGYGLFFTVVGIGQLAYAAVLAYRPDQRILSAGLAGTACLFGLYVVTRTIGIPWFGPMAGEVETHGPSRLALEDGGGSSHRLPGHAKEATSTTGESSRSGHLMIRRSDLPRLRLEP